MFMAYACKNDGKTRFRVLLQQRMLALFGRWKRTPDRKAALSRLLSVQETEKILHCGDYEDLGAAYGRKPG